MEGGSGGGEGVWGHGVSAELNSLGAVGVNKSCNAMV